MRVFMAVAVAVTLISSTAAGAGGNSLVKSGNVIVFIREGHVYSIDLYGSRPALLSKTRVTGFDPAVSPDARSIAYSVRTGDMFELWTMGIDGAHPSRLTRRSYDQKPVWSPDGKMIFFQRSVNRGGIPCRVIFRVGRDGRDVRRVTRPVAGHDHLTPSLSPDGQRVAYTDVQSCESGLDSWSVRVVDISGHPTSDLARLPGNKYYPTREYCCPTWSPDGTRLALGSLGLAVSNRDGSHLHRLSRFAAGSPFTAGPTASWSPDGSWIAFVRGNKYELYVVHPDGSGLHRLAHTQHAEWVSWLRR